MAYLDMEIARRADEKRGRGADANLSRCPHDTAGVLFLCYHLVISGNYSLVAAKRMQIHNTSKRNGLQLST
jgi:hypothetical protein